MAPLPLIQDSDVRVAELDAGGVATLASLPGLVDDVAELGVQVHTLPRVVWDVIIWSL